MKFDQAKYYFQMTSIRSVKILFLDLKSGNISATYIEQVNEGVFRRNTGEEIIIIRFIQDNPQRMRLQRQLYGINSVCFLCSRFFATANLSFFFFSKSLNKPS